MLQKLQSSGEMKGLLLFLFDQAAQLLGLRLRATVRVTQFHVIMIICKSGWRSLDWSKNIKAFQIT